LRLLEDETNMVQSEFLQLLHAQLGQILTSDGDGAASGQVNAAESIEQGGFAGAGGTHDGDKLAGVNVEVDTVEDFDAIRPA